MDGRIESSRRAGRDLVAGVDDDVFVVAGEQAKHLLDVAAVGRPRPLELRGASQELDARLVLHDELAQEFRIEPMQVVNRVDQRVAASQPKKQ
jgi:hypothetical protein